MTTKPDPTKLLEERLAYRVRAYAAGGRAIDDEFTLPGLRSWMLCQSWPLSPPSAWFEYVAVITWSAICTVETDPGREVNVRNELARQMEYLDGADDRLPKSLDPYRTEQMRLDLYASLREAAEPGSLRRKLLGLPQFSTTDRLTR